jgi:hypothetical protein
MSWLPSIAGGLLGLLAAPLAVAGTAKLMAAPDELSWPSIGGPLGRPHGPRLVAVAEIAAVAALLFLPGRYAGAIGVLAYATFTVVAHRLRGQPCACFGVARLAAIGRGHVTANAAAAALAAAVLAAAALPIATPAGPWLRLVVLAPAAAALTMLLAWRGRVAPCTRTVHRVRVYVSDECPACRSLRALLARTSESRRATTEIVVVRDDDELPPAVRGLGVPAAIGLDGTGAAACPPVSGVGDVKALVDRAVVGVSKHAYAG